MADRHICGRCNDEFLTEAEYVGHTCQITGTTPQDPAHLGPEFLAVQKDALERGKERLENPDQIAKQDQAIAQVENQIQQQ